MRAPLSSDGSRISQTEKGRGSPTLEGCVPTYHLAKCWQNWGEVGLRVPGVPLTFATPLGTTFSISMETFGLVISLDQPLWAFEVTFYATIHVIYLLPRNLGHLLVADPGFPRRGAPTSATFCCKLYENERN